MTLHDVELQSQRQPDGEDPEELSVEPARASSPDDSVDQHETLLDYMILMGVYNGAFVVFVAWMGATGRRLPRRLAMRDLLLLGVATHRLSRLVARERVTRPLRAPFTRYRGTGGGPNEVLEVARGRGMRRAIGQLLTCPWCTGMWAASLFVYGIALRPRTTRLFSSILAIDAISDFLHIGYGVAKKKLR